jgi:hypothetical protein
MNPVKSDLSGQSSYIPPLLPVRPRIPESPIHDRQIRAPRSDRLAISFGHHPADLRDVAEVVCHPRREKLTKRHRAELGMRAGERELFVGELPAAERLEIPRTQQRKPVEQLGDRPLPVQLEMAEAIEGDERAILALREDDSRSRNPVGLFAVNEMSDDIERAPRPVAFVAPQPFVAVAGQKSPQCRGRSLEDRDTLVNAKRRLR